MSQKSPIAVFVVQIRRMTSRCYFRGSSYPDLETNGNKALREDLGQICVPSSNRQHQQHLGFAAQIHQLGS